ncbi:UTP--glucose-1-phosphate uridylyltransferase GalU [Brevibacillus fluminis]|uniref:UTP--glucose-1-phosphate uridylyltransferase GalU n=1 Tax=Brevibacillus fluminis TaxID=511487 RepID=UPI003F8A39F8
MNRHQIKKAIIPAAGLGTRFLPATKAMPKEMLPIVDKPTIQYIVEEAVEAGIEDIIIVTGKGKRAIEDHFDHAFELEHLLLEKQKLEWLEMVRKSSKLANIHYIRQKEPLGLGHAIWCARKFIGEEPFAVLLGDDIVRADQPCIKQLADIFAQVNCSVVGVQEVPIDDISRYGVIDPLDREGSLYRVRTFVEKPPKEAAPSNLAIMGRYILTADIFDFLSRHEKGAGGEIQLTDAIQKLNERQTVYAYRFEGKRYDVGDKLGFITTTLEFALDNQELRAPLLHYLQQLLQAKKNVGK